MKWEVFCGLWFFYFAINVALGLWNDAIVKHRIKTGNTNQINHAVWLAIYCIIMVPAWFVSHDWFVIVSVALLHLSAFPVAYNAGMGLYWFHLSTTSKAITDKIENDLGLKNSEAINFGALAVSVAFLIVGIIK